MSTELIVILAVALVVLAAVALAAIQAVRAVQRFRRRRRARQLERSLLASGRATARVVAQTAARVRDEGLGGAFRGSIGQLLGWAESERPDLRDLAARDGTVSILFSDIEGSTEINHRIGDGAWVKVLDAHDAVFRGRVERHRGRIVKSQGDGFMIAFASPGEALGCAIEVQRDLANGARRLRKAGVRVRIGIHRGEAVTRDDDLFGRNVAIAARVADEARGEEILISEAVADGIGQELDLDLAGSREIALKGLPGRHRLLSIDWRA